MNVQFEGTIHAQTKAGLLFQGNYWDGPLWLPKSQVEVIYDDDAWEVVVFVKEWLARKRSLFEFTYYTEQEIEEISKT